MQSRGRDMLLPVNQSNLNDACRKLVVTSAD